MEGPVIKVGSVTYAMKGRDLLAGYGIRAYIERVQRPGEGGCGYGLYVPKQTDKAQGLLREHGIFRYYIGLSRASADSNFRFEIYDAAGGEPC